MASIIGVSSLYQTAHSPSPSPLELHPHHPLRMRMRMRMRMRRTRASTLKAKPLFPSGKKLFYCSARPSRLVATPNSVLSEEAFKGLGGLLREDEVGEEEEEDEDKYALEEEEVLGEDADAPPAAESDLAVANLGLPQELVITLEKRGITHLFPIQRAVLLPALQGRDLIARAKTGTGKTLAFGIPIIKKLIEADEGRSISRRSGWLPRVLILAPTKELAKQVEKEVKESAPYLNTVCQYGGVSYNLQQNALARGVDVVVGTPGRIIDLINNESLQLGQVQYLVLDEADQMLAVGFEEDVEIILEKLPSERQSMLFSATMPGWVKKLARKHLDNPLTIDLVGDEEKKLVEGIKLYAIQTTSTSKRTILCDLISVYAKGGKTVVFTQTKRDADEVSTSLSNSIASEALHGDISQPQRERILNGFRQGKFTVLVATDVAVRGLDIPNVDLIIHYELPNYPETFVHRSGRTGRAGKEGTAILMFTSSQRRTVKSLERDVGCRFEFISLPQINEVLESSAEQVVATLQGVHPESIKFFLPTAKQLTKRQGMNALAAASANNSSMSESLQVARGIEEESDILIECRNVHKSFGEKQILNGVSFKIRHGEAVGIIGPSGTGKSTVLKIMAGLLAPDKGEVFICGRKRHGLIDDEEISGLRIGLVFQSAALFDSLTVRENVGFLLYENSSMSEDQIAELVKDYLAAVGLKGVEDRMPSELSGGMKKRVALARSIIFDNTKEAIEPEVILYDEPTAGLDPIASTVVEDLIRSVHLKEDDGLEKLGTIASYVVVTHQHSTIRRAVDRLLFLYEGRIVWEGMTHEFTTSTNPIVRQFASGSLDGPIRY